MWYNWCEYIILGAGNIQGNGNCSANSLSGGASYVVMYALPILFCIVLYSDKNFSRITGILGIVIMLARFCVDVSKVGIDAVGNDVIMMAITILCFVYAWTTSSSHKQFEHDMRHSMLDEQALQRQMLGDILHAVEVAQVEIQDALHIEV